MAKRQKKQTEIEGTQRVVVPEVEEAAEDYRALRDERMDLATKEREAKAELVRKMESHGVTVYLYDDEEGVQRKIELTNKKNAKSTKIKKRDPDAPIETAA